MKKTIFIFRRDFRLNDNIALIKACKQSNKVIPIFIFDPYQVDKHNKNKYYISNNAIQFMCESLEDLNKQLKGKLSYFYGRPWDIIDKLLKNNNDIDAVAFNNDYSKYSLYRDKKIRKVCDKYDVDTIEYSYDLTLHNHEKVLKADGNMYLVFSAYYKKALNFPITSIVKNTYNNYIKIPSKYKRKYIVNNNVYVHGGRANALKILRNLGNYDECRDFMSYKTTRLSGYLKFGCVSIRECYRVFKNIELRKQLYWRSFYFLISQYVKNDYNTFIDPRFSKIKWENNPELWKKMWTGNTGYLVIDAAVRELNTTGYMHNRGRLLTGNFSVKILLLNPFHPKWGGQVYFSRMLIDGSYAQNVHNYSWVTGDKLDPSGMRFGKGISGRVFDPRKFKKWDPECEYVKKWLPKLKDVPNKFLFNWETHCHKYKHLHPSPIVDFSNRKNKWIKLCS